MKSVLKTLLCLTLLLAGMPTAVHGRLLDFTQQVSPNSDGQMEGGSSIFFNWGMFRSGFIYKTETIIQNYVDTSEDTFVNQMTKSYDIIVLKTKNGLIGTKTFSINPFIGVRIVDRTEKRVGEYVSGGIWFTDESTDTFVNAYGSADILLSTRKVDFSLTIGGGYIFKSTEGEFRNSTPTTLEYTSTDLGFNFFTDLQVFWKPTKRYTIALAFAYNREASYYERYYISVGSRQNYAYYIHEFAYGFHVHLNFLEKILKGTPFIGVTFIDYRRDILTGSKEKLRNTRFKFDVGVRL